jgi:hypothetical protein
VNADSIDCLRRIVTNADGRATEPERRAVAEILMLLLDPKGLPASVLQPEPTAEERDAAKLGSFLEQLLQR